MKFLYLLGLVGGLGMAQGFEGSGYGPLVGVVDKMEAAFGVPVHYEDPRSREVGNGELVVPRLRLTFPELEDRKAQVEEGIRRYGQAGMEGEFALVVSERRLLVAPKDAVLLRRVTIPWQRRSPGDALQVVLDEVSRQVGVKVTVGQIPLFPQTPLLFGAKDQTAWEVVMAILEQFGARGTKSVRLLYDPKVKWYMLNLQSF
jgi:hypothetical protein